MDREQWLEAAVAALRPGFEDAGAPLPDKVRVTCGWPSAKGLAAKNRTIGQAWRPEASSDGTCETFISPVIDDAATVIGTLVHELCHHAAGIDAGHKGEFARLARGMGLEGPMTATKPGPAVVQWAGKFVAEHGEYPHARMDPRKSGVKKQGTRMLKVVCPECGYTCRTTRTWLDVGLPTCCCGTPMVEDGPKGNPGDPEAEGPEGEEGGEDE